MNKIQAMKAKLSGEARQALAELGCEHIGYVVRMKPTMNPIVARLVLADLYRVGVIGANDGLTIMGSGVAAQLREELFEASF